MANGIMICPRCWGSKTNPGVGDSCGFCNGVGTAPNKVLSPHFMLSELLVSATAVRKHLANDPTAEHVAHLGILCNELMEPIRGQFGAIKVNSGLRLPAVNGALAGAATKSAHQVAWAADFVPHNPAVTLKAIVDWVIASQLTFDQVIYEGTWVHVARFGPDSKREKKQALMMFPNAAGKPAYTPYDPKDARVLQRRWRGG